MKRIIKLLTLIMATTLLFTFTACGGGGKDDSTTEIPYGKEEGKITFYVAGGTVELALWDNLIAEFEKQNEKIDVEPILFQDYDTIYQSLAAGNAADVIQVANGYAGNWAKAGMIKPLTQFINKDNFDTKVYWEQLISMFSYNSKTKTRGDGDLYALPKDFGVLGVYVNLDVINSSIQKGLITQADKAKLLDKATPLTFEEYRDLAVKLTVKSGTGVSQYGTNSIYAESYMWNNGTDLINDEYKLNVGDEKLYEVYDYIYEMTDKSSPYFCAPSLADTQSQDDASMFLSGKIAMYWAGRWGAPTWDAARMNYTCIPIPVVEKGQTPLSYAVSAGYAISKNCKNNGMAWEFVKFLGSETAYRILNKLNYAVPGIKSLIYDEEFLTPIANTTMTREDIELFFTTATNARRACGDYFTSNRWTDILTANLTGYYSGEYDTIDQCFKAMQTQVNAAIKKSDPSLFN